MSNGTRPVGERDSRIIDRRFARPPPENGQRLDHASNRNSLPQCCRHHRDTLEFDAQPHSKHIVDFIIDEICIELRHNCISAHFKFISNTRTEQELRIAVV